jgi:hypothetical protein
VHWPLVTHGWPLTAGGWPRTTRDSVKRVGDVADDGRLGESRSKGTSRSGGARFFRLSFPQIRVE